MSSEDLEEDLGLSSSKFVLAADVMNVDDWGRTWTTCDLSDLHGDKLFVVDPVFKRFGAKPRFHGRIVTLQVHNDNSLVKAAVESPGKGRVLVVDGSGSLRFSLLGDQLASAATKNGWSGIVIHGAIRDSSAINEMQIGVRALATIPRKTEKKNIGTRNVALFFANCVFTPGAWLYADEDGILVSPTPLLNETCDDDAPSSHAVASVTDSPKRSKL